MYSGDEFANLLVAGLAKAFVLGLAVGVAVGIVGTWLWLT